MLSSAILERGAGAKALYALALFLAAAATSLEACRPKSIYIAAFGGTVVGAYAV